MENVVVASLGLVAQIANAVQNVCTLRQRCQTLGSHVSRLEPFLKEIRDKCKEKHRFSPEAESLFRGLHDALEKAKKLVQDLKTTNRVKQFFMSKCLIDDLRDVSHDIQGCLSSLTMVTLQVSADGRDSLDEAKRNLEKLREDLNVESQEKALQLTGVVGKIHMILEEQKSLPGLIQSNEPLMLLADVLNTGIDEVKKDLQGLRDCMTWRSESKNATEDILFKWTLMAMGESWSSTVNSPANFQKALACPICREVFKDPVVISSGYTYCSMCIEKHSKNDNKCPVTREVVSLDRFPNRALDEVRSVLELDPLAESPDEFESPRQLAFREDVATSAKKFLSDTTGNRTVALMALRVASVAGKREIIFTENLVSSLFNHTLGAAVSSFEIKVCLEILHALTSAPKLGGASSSRAPQTASTPAEVEVFSILKPRLQDLVSLMKSGALNCRVLAAKVMANIIGGSVECFIIATRSLTGLVTAFFDLAVKDGDSSHIGLDGLMRLADPHTTGYKEHFHKDEALMRVLMDLSRDEVAMEESLVALSKVVGGYKGNVSLEVEDVSLLVSLVSVLPVGDGTKAVINILRRKVYSNGNVDAASERGRFLEIVEPFVPTLLAVVKGGRGFKETGDKLEGQEECIMLLWYVCKYGNWRLEVEEVPYLFDILLQDKSSNESKLGVLDIFAQNAENRHLWRPEVFAAERVRELLEFTVADISLRRGVLKRLPSFFVASIWLQEILRAGGTDSLCRVVAIDDDTYCRSYAAIALERLPRTDDLKEVLRRELGLAQVVKLFQIQGVDDDTGFEARGAAACLIGILISDREAEGSMIEAMTHLVEFLGGHSLACHKEKAAATLAQIICRKTDIAREWVVTSDCDGLTELVQFAAVSSDPGWKGNLYEGLALLCNDVDCQAAVMKSGGRHLLLEALQGGWESAAVALAELLVGAEEECLDVDLGKVVRAMKVRLQRRPRVDPVIVKAFGRLCSSIQTGICVAENGGIDVLLALMEPERSLECRAAAAHGLCNLLSLNLTQDLDVDGPLLQPTVNMWKARVAERRGVDVLLGVAGSIQCIEAVQALAAVSDNESAKTQLVERVRELLSMCLKGDRVQELVLKIFLYLSRGSLSKDSVSSLVAGGFPAIILSVLRTPTLASVTTAIKIVRNLSVESEEFTKVMLSTDEGAVKLLLAVLREPSGPDEIRECSVLALEMFMKEEKGRQQLMDADGIALLATELQRRPGCEQAKFYSLKVLLRLADPLIPKASKKLVWNMICTSDIFGAVGKGMDDNIPESNTPRTAVELLRACINETSDVSALCRRLEEASVYRSLANLRHQGHVEANEVVNLLVKKSKSARHALKKESRKLDDADDSFSSLAGGSPSSHSHRSIGFRD